MFRVSMVMEGIDLRCDVLDGGPGCWKAFSLTPSHLGFTGYGGYEVFHFFLNPMQDGSTDIGMIYQRPDMPLQVCQHLFPRRMGIPVAADEAARVCEWINQKLGEIAIDRGIHYETQTVH